MRPMDADERREHEDAIKRLLDEHKTARRSH